MRRSAAAAPVFAALGDDTRLRLVARLCEQGPTSTTGLAAGTPITRQAVAKHLQVLERAGLVHGRRQGRERLWELRAERLEVARAHLERISERWDRALDRLRTFVEG